MRSNRVGTLDPGINHWILRHQPSVQINALERVLFFFRISKIIKISCHLSV